MTTQEKINLIDIKDYQSIRQNKRASFIKWKSVRSLKLPDGQTFWQLLATQPDYDGNNEPSLTQLRKAMTEIKI